MLECSFTTFLQILLHCTPFQSISAVYRALQRGEKLDVHRSGEEGWRSLMMYSRFAKWQERKQEKLAGRALPYWKKQLSSLPTSAQLPPPLRAGVSGDVSKNKLGNKTPSNAVSESDATGCIVKVGVSSAVADSIVEASKEMSCTPFVVVLGGFLAALGSVAHVRDMCVLCPTTGRPKEYKDVVGHFINPIPVRIHLNVHHTVRDLLESVSGCVRDGMAFKDYFFSNIVKHVSSKVRRGDGQPISDTAVNYFDTSSLSSASPSSGESNSLLSALNVEQQATAFGLMLHVVRGKENSWHMELRARKGSVYAKECLENIGHQLQYVLGHFSNSLDLKVGDLMTQATLLSFDDRLPSRNVELRCVHTLAMEGLARNRCTGGSLAIVDGLGEMTYEELFSTASYVRTWLLGCGVARNTPVGIIMPKCRFQIVAMLGILQAGCHFVPFSNTWPSEREAFVAEMCDLKYTVTLKNWDNVIVGRTTSLAVDTIDLVDEVGMVSAAVEDVGSRGGELLAVEWNVVGLGCNDEDNEDDEDERGKFGVVEVDPMDPAYILFTSGSTGVPKGVVVTHNAITNTVYHMARQFQVMDRGSEYRVFGITQPTFDLAMWDSFSPLLVGGVLVLPPDEQSKNPEYWVDMLNHYKVTTWNSVPAFAQMLVEYASAMEVKVPSLEQFYLSGDFVPLKLPEQLCGVSSALAKVIPLGGCTETSIWNNYFVVSEIEDDWATIPYGFSMDGQKILVLNEALDPCAVGEEGQLYIAGESVGRGYLKNPERTNKVFVTLGTQRITKPAFRVYATGDRVVRREADGAIFLLGRFDFQVKLGGYRVELNEIEAIVSKYGGVQSVCAVVKDKKKLCLYYTLLGSVDCSSFDAMGMLLHLRTKLPSYMIPSHLILVDALPLNVNGKIDRNALMTGKRIKVLSDLSTDSKETSKGVDSIMEDSKEIPATKEGRLKEVSEAKNKEQNVAVVVESTGNVIQRVWWEVFADGMVGGVDETIGEIGGDSISTVVFVSKLRKRNIRLDMTMISYTTSLNDVLEMLK
eukprot:m.225960 g.225960  ORF g.225960 m.225960 type:complete len:1033 (+) comp13862_c0_seq2:7265-10363(+)